MVIVTIIIAQLSLVTVKAMVHGTRQTYAQSSAEYAVNKIANDIRSAGSDSDYRHILDGSGKTAILVRMFSVNQDSYSTNSEDLNYDLACYKFRAPSGTNQFDPSYKPGYIQGGSASGDPTQGVCRNYYPITDQYTDVRDMKIEYCRPGKDYGTFTCSTKSIDNGELNDYMSKEGNPDISETTTCVWMVRISVTYSKMHIKQGNEIDPNLYNNAVGRYQTSVMLRNPYLMSLFNDYDQDGRVDCCDPDYGMEDADWCPDPISS